MFDSHYCMMQAYRFESPRLVRKTLRVSQPFVGFPVTDRLYILTRIYIGFNKVLNKKVDPIE